MIDAFTTIHCLFSLFGFGFGRDSLLLSLGGAHEYADRRADEGIVLSNRALEEAHVAARGEIDVIHEHEERGRHQVGLRRELELEVPPTTARRLLDDVLAHNVHQLLAGNALATLAHHCRSRGEHTQREISK